MNRRSRWALLIVVALLAAGSWWVVRAPALERHAASPPADIDIDPPALRVRRDAAIAAAKMPDDPWTLAESLASSAPRNPLQKDSCGLEGRPQSKDLDAQDGSESANPTRAATPRYVAAQTRIAAALRDSDDPFDHAVADLLNVGDALTPTGRIDALVEQADTANDARVYGLAYGLCHAGSEAPAISCARLSARKWAELDPSNGVPWLDVLSDGRTSHDAAVQQEALAHLAAAKRFDIRLHGAAGAVANRLPDDAPELGPGADLVAQAATQSIGQIPSFSGLTSTCGRKNGGDEALMRQCVAISDVMSEHADSIVARAMGGVVLMRATGDTRRRDAYKAEYAALTQRAPGADARSECAILRDETTLLRRSAQIGETEAFRERAQRAASH